MLFECVGDVFMASTQHADAGPRAKHAVLASTRQVNLSSKRFSMLVDSGRINCCAGRADTWLIECLVGIASDRLDYQLLRRGRSVSGARAWSISAI